MALITGSNTFNTAFAPAIGSFRVQATGGMAILECRATSSSPWAEAGRIQNAHCVIDNDTGGVEYRWLQSEVGGGAVVVMAHQ